MKIFTIAATPFFSDRGCHIRIYNEAKYLQRSGAQVLLATYHLGKDVPGIETRRIRSVGWYRKISPGFAWGKVWLDLKLLFLSVREIRHFSPDIIHAHLFEGLAIATLAKWLAWSKAAIVLDLQGDLEKEWQGYNRRQTFSGRFFVLLSRLVARWADYVVVSSDRVSRQHFPGQQVSVVRDGVDLELFTGSFSDQDLLVDKIKRWAAGYPVMIYTGSVEDSKGVGELVEMFVKNKDELTDWKLLIVGHGNDLVKYQSIVKIKGEEERIYFTGQVDYFNLPLFLQLAKLAIDPKTRSSESSGKLVNYMAAGLPVAVYDNAFNRAILKEKGFYLTDSADLKKIARKVRERTDSRVAYDLDEIDEKKFTNELWMIFQRVKRRQGQ